MVMDTFSVVPGNIWRQVGRTLFTFSVKYVFEFVVDIFLFLPIPCILKCQRFLLLYDIFV